MILLDKTKKSEEGAAINDKNGIFSVELTPNGCCLHINSRENCVPYLLGAISKYAETHSEFKMDLVEVSAGNGATESEDVDRTHVDEEFTVIDSAAGKKMIFNKAENKAFTFRLEDESDPNDRKMIDVMELGSCKRAAPGVYAFQLVAGKGNLIGLVDILTGTVIKPRFIDLFYADQEGRNLIGTSVGSSDNSVNFSMIHTDPLRAEAELRSEMTYEDGNYNWRWFIKLKKRPGDYVDFINTNNSRLPVDRCNSVCFENDKFFHPDPCDNVCVDLAGFSDNKIDIYAYRKKTNGEYLVTYNGKNGYVCGVQCNGVGVIITPQRDYPLFEAVKANKFALFNEKRFLTEFDFTSDFKYLYKDDSESFSTFYLLAEIYGKKGLIAYKEGDGWVKTILPFEYDFINYYEGEKFVLIKDTTAGVQKRYRLENAVITKKADMYAAFNTKGERLTPFVKEENFSIQA